MLLLEFQYGYHYLFVVANTHTYTLYTCTVYVKQAKAFCSLYLTKSLPSHSPGFPVISHMSKHY